MLKTQEHETGRSQPRVSTARRISVFDRSDATRRLFEAEECYGDFMIVGQLARPSAETSFDVCSDGESLFVTVLVFDSAADCGARQAWPLAEGAGPGSVEILVSPYGDGVGFLQFAAGPGAVTWFHHHWPYRDGRAHLAARPVWDSSCEYHEMGEDAAWTVCFRLPLAAIRGEGYEGPLGFNVMRTQLRTDESAAWSHTGGAGFSDATSCGWLQLSDAPVVATAHPVQRREGSKEVQLQATYDFPDEMTGGVYTPDTLRAELRTLRQHGFGRVYWIDYPLWLAETERLIAAGMAEPHVNPPWGRVAQNFQRTIEAFGGDPMPACARMAHEEGLEFFTVMKPYDNLSLDHSLPECGFARNPAWAPVNAPESAATPFRLALFADNAAPLSFSVAQVRVFVSSDNRHYRPCEDAIVKDRVVTRPRYIWTPAGKKATQHEETVRVLYVEGLPANAPYLALEFPAGSRKGELGNQEYLLAEAEGHAVILSKRVNNGGFLENGFDFQNNGAPAGWSDCSEGMEIRRSVEAGHVLGIRFGQEQTLAGMLDPAYPQVRDHWLQTWVQRAIDAGADGVDVRIAFHAECNEWLSFAFAEPVVAAFRRQTGREPQACHEDYAAIRRIRGDFHTQFLREAKALLGVSGKRLEAHVEARMKTPPEHDTYAQIHWDYATWIDEGIVDGINLKYLGPCSTFVAEQVLPRARQRGIPVHVIAAVGDARTQPRTPEWAAELLAMTQASGLDGLNLYEMWTFLRATPEGTPFYRGCARAVFAALQEQREG